MKRTYVNRLPKNEEVKNTNVRIENGELVVEVEFEDKFEPKDGDFIYYKSGCSNATFICKYDEMDKKSLGCYAAFQLVDTEPYWNFSSRKYAEKRLCRYATAEEKSSFLERLEKEYGKRWNEEKKCLEDIRWRAKYGEQYFTVNSNMEIVRYKDENVTADRLFYNKGNYFRTHEAAQKVADQIKEIFKNSKAE